MNDQPAYNYKVVRQFSIMSVAWGIVGMPVGVLIAAQLIWPELNLAPWLSYGRLPEARYYRRLLQLKLVHPAGRAAR
jgi:cbb3-type cytochrome oxidase subunit 1